MPSVEMAEWMRGQGPESDIVMSSRIRLARNLSEFPFIRKCTPKDRVAIATSVHRALDSLPLSADTGTPSPAVLARGLTYHPQNRVLQDGERTIVFS